jgi:predicted tellurium resistance membrane protein TerC
MTGLLTSDAITAFFQVIMIDLVLAGDNAIVIGLLRLVCRTSSARRRSSLALAPRRHCALYSQG